MSAFPLGAAYVAGAARRAGWEVKLLDLCFVDDPATAAQKGILGFQPDVILLSLRNLFTTSMFVIPTLKPLVDRIKEVACSDADGVPVIIGGGAFSLFPREILQYYGLRYGVVGEGEAAIGSLLRNYASLRHPILECLRGVPGFCWMEDSHFCWNPPCLIRTLHRNARPFRDDVEPGLYQVENIQTKRGCPLGCIYCTYPLLEGRKVRCRTALDVVNELEDDLILKRDVRDIAVVDSTFNNDLYYAKEVCREIVRRGLRVRLRAYVTPKFVDPELVRLMKEANFLIVELGVDSACDKVLAALHKGFTKQKLAEVLSWFKQEGIWVYPSLLLRGPKETMDSIKETLDFFEKVEPFQLFVNDSIIIWPRTEIFRIATRSGIVNCKTNLMKPTFYSTDGLGQKYDQIKMIVREYQKRNPHWIYAPLGEMKIVDPASGREPLDCVYQKPWSEAATASFKGSMNVLEPILQDVFDLAVRQKAYESAVAKQHARIETVDVQEAVATAVPPPLRDILNRRVSNRTGTSSLP